MIPGLTLIRCEECDDKITQMKNDTHELNENAKSTANDGI